MQAKQRRPSSLADQIGRRARVAREAKALTQAEVAEAAGLAAEVYGRIERGRMMPSVPTLRRLCRTLDLSADDALGLTEPAALRVEEPPPKLVPVAPAGLVRRLGKLSPAQQRLIDQLARELRRR